MNSIILTNQPLSTASLKQQTSLEINSLSSLASQNPKSVRAYTPYSVSSASNHSPKSSSSASSNMDSSGGLAGSYQSSTSRSTLTQLSDPNVCQSVTDLSLCYGGENILALADVFSPLMQNNLAGVVGATTSVNATRTDGFTKAVNAYKKTLLEYGKAYNAQHKNQLNINNALRKVRHAFNKLQINFGLELEFAKKRMPPIRSVSSPLYSSNNGIHIARHNRNITQLNLNNGAQAKMLTSFASKTKFLGNSLAVIDFGSRIGNITNKHKAGGDWEREMFKESLSFAISAGVGIATVSGGIALGNAAIGSAMGVLILATPFGWAALLIGGAAIAAGAFTASYHTNQVAKSKSDGLYDWIMSLLG